MKVSLIILLASVLLISCEDDTYDDIVVIKDCTGSYLRINDEDYLVCNKEKLDDFTDGTEVEATYKIVDKCEQSPDSTVVCMMFHDYEGLVNLTSVELDD